MNLIELALELGTDCNTLREFAPDETQGYDDYDTIPYAGKVAFIREAWNYTEDEGGDGKHHKEDENENIVKSEN